MLGLLQKPHRILLAPTDSTKVLVILHLYYLEMWGYFEKKLKNIGNHDLIITIPTDKRESTPQEIQNRNNTRVVYLRNKGRDVLPFFTVLKQVELEQYSHVLKLHSKKSPHYEKGNLWLDSMVESLTSATPKIRNTSLFRDAAIVGPKGQFFSLRVNYEANGLAIDRTLRRFVSRRDQYNITQVNRADYGFFAGTMFWANAQYLEYLRSNIRTSSRLFEGEAGQIDGTYAHALERIITLVAEANKLNVCEIDTTGNVTSVDYTDGIIPEWSDLV